MTGLRPFRRRYLPAGAARRPGPPAASVRMAQVGAAGGGPAHAAVIDDETVRASLSRYGGVEIDTACRTETRSECHG